MSIQQPPIYLVTVNKTPEITTALFASVIKDIEPKYNIIHIANCQTLTSVKTILTSLITPPRLLITGSEWFDDEQEEVREIVKRVLPDAHLITIPPGLHAQEGDKAVAEYLTEQVSSSKLPTRS